jgi:GST-like protein
VKAWFSRLRVRPAVAAGMALGKELRAPAMTEEAKKLLFGQDASTVKLRTP